MQSHNKTGHSRAYLKGIKSDLTSLIPPIIRPDSIVRIQSEMSQLLGLVQKRVWWEFACGKSWHNDVEGIVIKWIGVRQVLEGGQGHVMREF